MESQLVRYLEGDLGEVEAMQFLDAIARDPALEADLRAHEHLLAAAARLAPPAPSPSFADAVMEEIRQPKTVVRPRSPRPSSIWIRRATLAASMALLFLAGYAVSQRGLTPRDATLTGESFVVDASTAPTGFRMARLVYVPTDRDPSQVSVAGTFNGWSSQELPMQKEGPYWTAAIVLPEGNYEYMFVEDGEHWVTDPLATQTRDDGFGGRNAVLDLRS